MKFKISKEIYSKDVLLKASYHFTDSFYVFLDADEDYYYITLDSKDSSRNEDVEALFKNELITQATREKIYNKTSNIRELILARAFATTIIEDNTDNEPIDKTVNENGIFEDWFNNES